LHGCSAVTYKLSKDNTTCLIVETTATASVSYTNSNRQKLVATWPLGEAAAISGQCESETKGQASLNLTFADYWVHMSFASSGGKASLAGIELFVTVQNGSRFLSPNSTGGLLLTASPKLPLSADTEHFACASELRLPFGQPGGSALVLSATKIQAFGVRNGSLSAKFATCALDARSSVPSDSTTAPSNTTAAPSDTTTAPSDTTAAPSNTTAAPSDTTAAPSDTTAAPSDSTTASTDTAAPTNGTSTAAPPTSAVPTTASPEPPLLNVTVFNSARVPCLRLQLRASLSILYRLKSGGNATVKVALPADTKASGDCGNSSQTVQLSFMQGWRSDLIFVKKASGYALQHLAADYRLSPALFPNAAEPNANRSAFGNGTYFSVASGTAYYSCRSAETLRLDNFVTMETRDLRAQAFRTDNSSAEFAGSMEQCLDDTPIDNVVPIVVGAALAGLVIIVLIAYLIGRRRHSAGSGYQSV
ncbi:hypothetical protein BOX15_Mlig027935g1, partial [Macrostomum lignano]